MTKNVITLLCLLILAVFPITAQEQAAPEDDYMGVVAYSPGEQIFSLNAGGIFPLFSLIPFHDPGASSIGSLSSAKPGLSGSLKLGFFVADNFLLGGELSGMISMTDNRSLTIVPLTFMTTYYFLSYPFEFPVSLNAGIALNTLSDYFKITPIIKPGIGAYWNLNGEWALGINAEYWFIPELYFSDEYSYQSRIANFLQLSLSGVYHF